MRLEYVGSAFSFVFTSPVQRHETPEYLNFIKNTVDIANNWFPYHTFSVLFNGYNEPDDAEYHKRYFGKTPIYVDSGGLQMITLGRTPTDELREKVYNVQAKYGDYGLVFDEIPLRVTGKSQAVDVVSNARKFDRSMIAECAKQTAINIIKQIDIFDKLNSKCKPFMIIQGNGVESYQEWTDKILNNIPDDYQNKLAGIASGGACIGDGELEDLERYFTLSHLNAPKHLLKHFHLLGVGSPNRIQTLMKVEHLFDDTLISYDSTKHTGGVVRSQFQIDASIKMIGRHRNNVYWEVFNKFDAFQHSQLSETFTEEEFHDALLFSQGLLDEKYGKPDINPEFCRQQNKIRFAACMFSVYNLFNLIDKVKSDTNFVSKSKKKNAALYRTLEQVKNFDDFKYWKLNYGKYLESNRTKSVEDINSSLEEFF